MAFFSRVMNYVFNELLVDALANSKTFQRFAVRTDKALREAQASGKISKLADAPTEANVRVHVCESWDRSTLVVHGEARRHGGEDGDGRGRIAKKCCVTVLPSPASVKPGTAIAATHMSYVSAALSPFHPSWSGVTPAAVISARVG